MSSVEERKVVRPSLVELTGSWLDEVAGGSALVINADQIFSGNAASLNSLHSLNGSAHTLNIHLHLHGSNIHVQLQGSEVHVKSKQL